MPARTFNENPPDAKDGAADFMLDIGDDLLAEALAAVERRESESRAHRRPADPVEMAEFSEAFELEEAEPSDLAGDDDAIVVGGDEDYDDGTDDEDIDLDGILDGDEPIEAPDEGDDGTGALIRELARVQTRLRDSIEAGEVALDRAADLEAELAERDGLLAEATVRADELTLRLRKYKAARKKELEDRRRLELALARTRERADRAEQRALDAEDARDVAKRSLQESEARVAIGQRDLERAHERRRRELTDQRWQVQDRTWRSVLPMLDNLELAVHHAGANPDQLLTGVSMVVNQFHSALSSADVQRVSAAPGQPFDPAVHEAIEQQETDEQPPGTIVQELQSGFVFGGRLLRPARVSVAKAPPVPQPEDGTADSDAAAPVDGAPEVDAPSASEADPTAVDAPVEATSPATEAPVAPVEDGGPTPAVAAPSATPPDGTADHQNSDEDTFVDNNPSPEHPASPPEPAPPTDAVPPPRPVASAPDDEAV